MKTLIKKEFSLGWKWYNYLFFIFPVMILIPNYPLFTGVMYVFFFVTTLFPSFLTNNDFKFMTGLPIRRKDIVASKHFDILFGELGTLFLAVVMLLIKAFVIRPEKTPLMDPNFAFLGMTLLEYAVFNLIFMSVYFTELKLPKSILCSLTGFFLSIALLEVLIQVVPPFRAVLDSLDTSTILWRLLVFFIGVAGFIVGNIAAFRIACKRFLRYNM